VVISDYSMPGFSGAEALKILRARTADIPFIYVSGTLGEETAIAALKSGAQDYLVKGKLGRIVPAIERELRDAEGKRERKRLETQIHQLQRFEANGGRRAPFRDTEWSVVPSEAVQFKGTRARDSLAS
jgi:DNA-binding NtrC family response regulator